MLEYEIRALFMAACPNANVKSACTILGGEKTLLSKIQGVNF